MEKEKYVIIMAFQENNDADAIKFAHKIAKKSHELNEKSTFVELGHPHKLRFNVYHNGQIGIKKKKNEST